MRLETELNIALTDFFRPIVAQCVQEAIQKISISSAPTISVDSAPVLSSKQVKDMTGWPTSTFYAKVGQMPAGVCIRKSKRLLFDREKFIKWLKTPVEP